MILFFVPEFGSCDDGVLNSQIFSQMDVLNGKGKRTFVLASEYLTNLFHARNILKKWHISGEVLPHNSKQLTSLPQIVIIIRSGVWLLTHKQIIKETKYIYTRHIFTGYCIFLLRHVIPGIKWVHDVRGLTYEEFLYSGREKHHKWLKSKILLLLEKICIKNADSLLCVSSRLAEYCSKIRYKNSIYVIPSSVDYSKIKINWTERRKIRDLWGISESDWVFVYNGSLLPWQHFEDTLTLISILQIKIPKSHAVIISSNVTQASQKIAEQNLDQSRVHFFGGIQLAEISKYLSIGDIGLLIRDNILLNNVASPIKISEYLACGLGIACSTGIGDISDLIITKEVGCIIDKDLEKAAISIVDFCDKYGQKNELKNKSRRLCIEKFSWRSSIPTLLNIYG